MKLLLVLAPVVVLVAIVGAVRQALAPAKRKKAKAKR